jgi:hypothetical protein
MDNNQQNNPQPNLGTPSAPAQPPVPPQAQQIPPTNTPPQPQQTPAAGPLQGPPQPPPPQLVDVPDSKKTNPVKKILMIAFGFLFISALIVGGYYLFTLFTKDDASSTAQPTQTQESGTSTPIPTVDPTANWKLYSNTKYGFSFKHPADWTHNMGIGNNIGIAETNWSVLEGPYEDVNTATSGGIRNEISINTEESKLLFKDYLNETGTLFESIEEERSYQVGSISGYLFKGLFSESVEGAVVPTPAMVVVLNKEDVYVEFKLKRFNPNDNTIDPFTVSVFDEILATFEFAQ